jgi:hypothetical protein
MILFLYLIRIDLKTYKVSNFFFEQVRLVYESFDILARKLHELQLKRVTNKAWVQFLEKIQLRHC